MCLEVTDDVSRLSTNIQFLYKKVLRIKKRLFHTIKKRMYPITIIEILKKEFSMKNILLASALLIAGVHAQGAQGVQYPETSELFYGEYSENYVMRWHFQKLCQHSFDPRTNEFMWPTKPGGVTFDPADVKAGDLIFVRDVGTFFKTLAPKIKQPYVMVTAGEYRDQVQEKFLNYLDDAKIIAWFSVHACEKTHKKFYQLPLGIFQDKKYLKPRAQLTKQFAQLRNAPKKGMLYMNFGDLRNKKPERAEVIELLAEQPFCYKAERLPFLEYMKEMSQYKFSLSPRGYGPDSYRTWEAMLVGSIPVVRTSQLDSLYADLPVLIIDDWAEITEEFLERKYKEMTPRKYNIEKLFMEYWTKRILSVRDAFFK